MVNSSRQSRRTARLRPLPAPMYSGAERGRRNGGYRLFVSTPGGSEEVVAPAESVLHIRIGAGRASPWRGRSPLAGSMADVELALIATEAVAGESSIKSHGMHSVDSETRTTANPDALANLAKQLIANPSGRTYFSPVRFRTDRDSSRARSGTRRGPEDKRRTDCGGSGQSRLRPAIGRRRRGRREGSLSAFRAQRLSSPWGILVEAEASAKLGQPVRLDFSALRASDTAMMARAAEAFARIPNVSTELALELAGAVSAE